MAIFKLASGILTVADMESEPSWEDLALDAGFPSGLFQRVRWPREPQYPDTFYRAQEEVASAGDLSRVAQGAGVADWVFFYFTRAGLGFARSTFCTDGLSSTVTLQMPDSEGTTVTVYGTLWWPQPAQDMRRLPGGWGDVLLRFRGLRAAAAE